MASKPYVFSSLSIALFQTDDTQSPRDFTLLYPKDVLMKIQRGPKKKKKNTEKKNDQNFLLSGASKISRIE